MVFHLLEGTRIRVGRKGDIDFPAGYYLYVGSARSGLEARIARHRRREKRLHWHIDYLSLEAEFVRAYPFPGDTLKECGLAELLAQVCAWSVPRFGSSDCHCQSHLFAFRKPSEYEAVLSALTRNC